MGKIWQTFFLFLFFAKKKKKKKRGFLGFSVAIFEKYFRTIPDFFYITFPVGSQKSRMILLIFTFIIHV
jgi:hypothetical protein